MTDPNIPEVLRQRGVRGMMNGAKSALDNANEASKRIEETANTVAVALVCVALASIVALGLATMALVAVKRAGTTSGKAE
jgi:hypothetical protein